VTTGVGGAGFAGDVNLCRWWITMIHYRLRRHLPGCGSRLFFAERATRSAPRRSMLLNVVKAKRHESDLTPQLLADIVFSVKRPPSADCAVVKTTDFFRRASA
jgi:hypothetical protein